MYIILVLCIVLYVQNTSTSMTANGIQTNRLQSTLAWFVCFIVI